jgi:polyvinyl alcohol dehydrogenase (cytochrome)
MNLLIVQAQRQCMKAWPRQWMKARQRQGVRLGIVAAVAILLSPPSVLSIGTPAAASADRRSTDWPTYQLNNARVGFNSAERIITSANAANLKVHWTIQVPGSPNAISAQPVVAHGKIYWGSWDGFEHATSLSGTAAWSPDHGYLGQTSDKNCNPPVVGVASTATVTGGRTNPIVYAGGGNPVLYALNGKNGTVIGATPLGSSPSHFIWSSPAVYNGSVYIGNSSFGDCPLIQGQLVKSSASTGEVQHIFNVVPDGCLGGSVWGSPTIDEALGKVYIATGNPGSCISPYTDAVMELNAADLSYMDSWQMRGPDNADLDFGSTPTLFQAGTTPMLGVVNKNGEFVAFQRDALGAGPVWRVQVGNGGDCPQCGSGNISPAAWDGRNLYVASGNTSINGGSCQGSLRKLDPATGDFLWQTCLHDGPVLGAVTAVPGVAFVGEGTHFVAIDTSSGNILFNYDTGSNIWGAASISNGVAYVGNQGGTLYAFGP